MPEQRQPSALLRPVTVENVQDEFLLDKLLVLAVYVAKRIRDRY